MLQDQCLAIDVNLGCPQNVAKKGGYGAFVAQHPDVVEKIGISSFPYFSISTLFFSHFQSRHHNNIYQTVKALVASLHVPITAKMRISSTCEETIAFAKMLERAGCKMIAIHGRRKEQKDHTVQPDWEIIKETMYHLSTIVIP